VTQGRALSALRLGLLFGVHAVGTATIMCVMAFAPAIRAELGISASGFGLMVAAYYAAQPVASMAAGWAVDRVGVRMALALAMAATSAATFALSAMPTAWGAAAVLVLAGLGYSLVNPATSAGVVAWFPPDWRSTMMSTKQAGVPIGGIMAAAIAAAAGGASWRWALAAVAVAALGIVLWALLLPGPRGADARGAPPPGGLRAVIGHRPLLRVCLLTGLLTACQAAFFAFLVIYLSGPMGLTPEAAALVFGLVHAISAVSRIAWGLLADRWWRGDVRACLRVVAIAAVLGFVALGAAQSLGLPLAIAAALLLGATVTGFAGVAQGAAVGEAPRGRIGAAMGLYMTVTPIGNVAGPPVFGALLGWSGGFLLPFLLLAALSFAALLVIGFRRDHQPKA
jgi:MFS family permease